MGKTKQRKVKPTHIFEAGACFMIVAVLGLNLFNALVSDKGRTMLPDLTNLETLNTYLKDYSAPKNTERTVGTLIQHLENNYSSFTMEDLKPHLEGNKYVYVPSMNEFVYIDDNFEFYQTGASPEDNVLVGAYAYDRYGTEEAIFHLNTYSYDTHKFDTNGNPIIISYSGYNVSFPE